MPHPALQLLERKFERQKRIFEFKRDAFEKRLEEHMQRLEARKDDFERRIERHLEEKKQKIGQSLESQKKKPATKSCGLFKELSFFALTYRARSWKR